MTVKSLLMLILAALFASVAYFVFKSYTPPIFSTNAIAKLEAVDINNDRQYLLIRGHDRRAPVLLFLHGGPGMPAMYLAHDFQRELEKHFVVVHWDQRGAGKSYRKDIRPDELSISQLLDDTTAVVSYLQETLGVEKVWLVGHSFGSYLGAQFAWQHPDLLHAYIGIGQITDPAEERALQDEFLKSKLVDLGLPADTEITGANREDLLFKTHSELYGAESFIPLLITGLMAPEYSLFDALNIAKGSSFSSAHMMYDVMEKNIMDHQIPFEVPVVIMMGAHDMVTPTALAKQFYDTVQAPEKYWVEFEQSAHFPFFEEPDRFTEEMVKLKAATSDR